ncbi:FixH family protein [Inmirania thermothiophila]|uniref:Nitrogen fixation protein FixH n=1 Tax=Inmirania thermothiophila TaxID=1750597 RepID=A0A3N1Y6L1_9GAMM|nr:FixH family protein [Inmirania thermothiophila]ROR34456.1 nitrogen fixation protein FixH [Inmirania thermothiophila]
MGETTRRDRGPAWKNPWVLAWYGVVLAILVANGVMITLAVRTNPGLVKKDYYESGQRYGETLAAEREARALGWSLDLALPAQPRAGAPASVHLLARDGSGLPLQASRAHLYAYRPADARADFDLPLTQTAAGRYRAELRFPLPGVWDLVGELEQGGRIVRVARRIEVLAGGG